MAKVAGYRVIPEVFLLYAKALICGNKNIYSVPAGTAWNWSLVLCPWQNSLQHTSKMILEWMSWNWGTENFHSVPFEGNTFYTPLVAWIAWHQKVLTLAGSMVALWIQKSSFTLQNWTLTITIAVIIRFLHWFARNIGLKSISNVFIFTHECVHVHCNLMVKKIKIQTVTNALAAPGILQMSVQGLTALVAHDFTWGRGSGGPWQGQAGQWPSWPCQPCPRFWMHFKSRQ